MKLKRLVEDEVNMSDYAKSKGMDPTPYEQQDVNILQKIGQNVENQAYITSGQGLEDTKEFLDTLSGKM